MNKEDWNDIANGRDKNSEIRIAIAIAWDEAKETTRKELINAELTTEEKIFKIRNNE